MSATDSWKSANHHAGGTFKGVQTEIAGAGIGWAPLQAGLFDGKLDRVNAAAEAVTKLIRSHSWF